MKKLLLMSLITTGAMVSCSHHTYVEKSGDASQGNTNVAIGYPNSKTQSGNSIRVRIPETGGDNGKSAMVPNASVFRMSGNYSKNVAVTLSPDGQLLYFPAPTDITADSEPVSVGDGWWLNNQGIGPNSVFTKYTFAEYAALPETPSPEQIKLHIIPGAKVTSFMELPWKIGEANIETVKEYVKKNE